ncbi:MAG TPA: hypothetical protein VF546_22510 [Pyrinomonadaceae bacterium]|jgi:hypothetical protein
MSRKRRTRNARRSKATSRPHAAPLLRAVVGSLVLCAALGTPAAAARPAQGPPVAAAPVNGYDIDPQPLRAWAAETRRLLASGQLDRDGTLDLSIDTGGVDGRGFASHVEFSYPGNNDRGWVGVAVSGFDALNRSRVLRGLEGAARLQVRLKLDGQIVSAHVVADYDSAEQAARLAHTAGQARAALAALFERDREPSGLAVLNNMTVTASGKQLTLKLELSRELAGNLLRQRLAIP